MTREERKSRPPSPDRYEYIPADRLIPHEIFTSLSAPASMVYANIVNRIRFTGRNPIAATNATISKFSRVRLSRLLKAQHELKARGLLAIQFETRPGFVPLAQRVEYTLLPSPPAGVDHEPA